MRSYGDPLGGDDATSLPSGFKYLVGGAAFFIAGCSAFFSVRGLGLLFIGSATAVMIMAASLEVGKLVAAAFLYRYWEIINRPMRAYLLVAILVLIGITSLGNYGYLARAYERTHTRVASLEGQIAMIDKESADIQRQIDGARGQLSKTSDTGRDGLTSLQQRITAANTSLDQALARLQERRKIAEERRDHDLQSLAQTLAERNGPLNKALASEDALIAGFTGQLAVLDRAVDAYTKQGGPGFFKADSIKKGQDLREQQARERAALVSQTADHRARQDQLRAEHATNIEANDRKVAAARQQFDQAVAGLDSEEKELRTSQAASIAQLEQQLAAAQTLGATTTSVGSSQLESLYQRIRTNNAEIQHLRQEIGATDIGTYRFVARAFDASSDNVVKWLALVLVMVFDPLAVSLAVGFNVALLRERRRSPRRTGPPANAATVADAAPVADAAGNGRRPRWAVLGLSVLLLTVGSGAIAFGAHWGLVSFRQHVQTSHAQFVPGNSFTVMTLCPAQLKSVSSAETLTGWLGAVPGKVFSDSLTELMKSGFDAQAEVYAFVKFPEKNSETGDRPVMIAGLVARVADPAVAEAALARMADQISASLRASTSPAHSPAKSRAMIRYGRGRYLDPEGGFFTFGLAGSSAVLLIELEGDPQAPQVEREMQTCLATRHAEAAATDSLPARAFTPGSVASVWFDAARFFSQLPKNPAAQVRYQQLQRYLDFDLVLRLRPAGNDHLTVTADYAYKTDRFKDRLQPTALQVLAHLGHSEAAGLGGQLIDRCADTLDYDSLIERLRASLSSGAKPAEQEVLVEKSFASDRDAQFVVSARYVQPTGVPVASAR